MLTLSTFQCPELVNPVEHAVLRPDGHEGKTLPLLYVLHGGGGSREHLKRVAPVIERAWAAGSLPPLVAVTPSEPNDEISTNIRDAEDRWEAALIGSFLEHVRATYGASRARHDTMISGTSRGGQGSLRLALKHPDLFGAAAALAPGIQPVIDFAELDPRELFWLRPEALTKAFGSAEGAVYWRANNPAAIVRDHAARLRDAGLALYLECGDRDSFGTHRGVEFLHRQLFDNGISHEYRLVRGADHLGPTLPDRFADALGFLGKALAPPAPDDPALIAFHERVAKMKQAAGLTG
jgi:S-formylglutathione hydrolase